MKYLRYLALVALLTLPLAYSQAEVRIGVGFGPTYVAGPPVCSYGYYSYYPYACAPYGYYGPSWFVNGVFIGVGPWHHRAWVQPYYGRPYYGRSYYYGRGYDRDDYRHGFVNRGYYRHDRDRDDRGWHDRGDRGDDFRGRHR